MPLWLLERYVQCYGSFEVREGTTDRVKLNHIQYQGGAYDPWGGPGFENCAALLNHEFERVFYKSNWAAKTTIFNIYMVGRKGKLYPFVKSPPTNRLCPAALWRHELGQPRLRHWVHFLRLRIGEFTSSMNSASICWA
jgi:hypothetical protein